jgi:L-asparaginase II
MAARRRVGLVAVGPIEVTVRRGGVVEATHVVHAVAVRDGAVVEQAGDAERIALLRSSAKPFQALPLVRARDDLTTEEIAIASASHLASPEQLAAVRSLLAKAPAEEHELECGRSGSESGPTAIQHNCSGKHAGMLALCRTNGWASGGYRLGTHPVQHACLHEVAAAADVDPEEIPTAVDGCGVLTFALPLERMALMFARLEQVDGGARVAAAMRAHPELIRGPMAADSLLMRELDGWAAKGGAEGLLCASGPGGLGIALKIEDGGMRAMRPALAELLRRLGFETGDLGVEPLENSRGEIVGEIVSDRSLAG